MIAVIVALIAGKEVLTRGAIIALCVAGVIALILAFYVSTAGFARQFQ